MTARTQAPTVRALLDFEQQHEHDDRGQKAYAVWQTFRIPFARYVQLLGRAIDTREALEHDALLTHRLIDRRAARNRKRAARIGTAPARSG